MKYLILDEADRMLDMGFLPDMVKLVNGMGMPPNTERQTLMFSATFPEEVQKLAREILNDYIFVTVGHVGGANVDIEQRVIQVDKLDKREKLISILNEQGQSDHQIAVNCCCCCCCCCCCDSPAALLLSSVVQVAEVCDRSRVVPQVLHCKLRRMFLTVEQMLCGVWCHSTLRTDI